MKLHAQFSVVSRCSWSSLVQAQKTLGHGKEHKRNRSDVSSKFPVVSCLKKLKLSPGFLKNIQRLHACFGLVTTNRERTVSGCLVKHIQWFHANEC